MDTIEALRRATLNANAAVEALDELRASVLRLGRPFEECAQDLADIRRLVGRRCSHIERVYERERTREEPMGQ